MKAAAPYVFTKDFTLAFLHRLTVDATLISRVSKYLNADRMPGDAPKVLARVILDYHKTHQQPPSRLVVEQLLDARVASGAMTVQESANACEALLAGAALPEVSGAFCLEQVIDEERKAAMWTALDQGLQRWKSGEYQDISRNIERAANLGREASARPAVDYFATLVNRTKARLSGIEIARCPTGIGSLDAALKGGLAAGELGCVLGAPKSGKCHRADQDLLMADGTLKNVTQIVEGDLLMGPDSQPRRVLCTNTGTGQLFEIRPNYGGRPWAVNSDHILTVSILDHGREIWVDVAVKDWLNWSQHKKVKSKLIRVPVEEFHRASVKLPIDPYFLGVLLGDGCISKIVCVTTPEPEIVQMLSSEAVRWGLRLVERPQRGCSSFFLSGSSGRSNPIQDEIRQLGLSGTDSGSKFIPDAYKYASWDDRMAILAGAIDTDGYRAVSPTGRDYYEYTSKSKRLADDLLFIARSLGFRGQVRAMEKSCQTGAVGTYYRFTLSGVLLYQIPCRVPRKKINVAPGRCRNELRCGFTIVPCAGVDEYYGFSLDGDSRYLLDDFTVTHNSQFLAFVAMTTVSHGGTAIYYSLEMSEASVLERMDAAISRTPMGDLNRLAVQVEDEVLNAAVTSGGSLYVHQFPPGATTVNDIEESLRLHRDNGITPTVLIVDYGDLLASDNKFAKRYDELGEVYTDLRRIAVTWDIPVWTASQAKREALEKSVVTIADVGESFKKVQIADVIIALCGTEEERKNKIIRMYVAACRYASGGVTAGPFKTAFEQGRIWDDAAFGDEP
jgi:replicative DNA helicase